MTQSGLITCLGRFLLELPSGTRIRSVFVSGGARVVTDAAVTPEAFEGRVRARQEQLEQTPHAKGGDLLVERYELDPGHEVLVSWSSSVGRRIYRYDEFQYFADEHVLFRFESQGSANAAALDRARAGQRKFGAAMRVRDPAMIPTEPGFCVERGFVSGSTLNREEVEAVFSFPGLAHTSMVFKSFVTRNPEPTLLERVRELPSDLQDSSSGLAAVHRAERTLDGLQGSEVVIEERDEGRISHEFAWEFPGQADSLAAPFVKFSMTLDNGALGDGGAFQDLDEAIQFWHGLTASLRLRPGAV